MLRWVHRERVRFARIRVTWSRWLAAVVSNALLLAAVPGLAVEFVGQVVDAESGTPLAARIYLRAPDGQWLHVEAGESAGTALPYREQWVKTPGAEDQHTTVSAHPFRIDLEPGTYELTVERGKEYLPLHQSLELGAEPRRLTFPLRRWINMSERGWWSGETHVHRRLHELPNVMLAEDLNVAFPVTFWTTEAFTAPTTAPSRLRRVPSPFGPREDRGYEPIPVDAQHVIVPRNTEYEIFSVDGQAHVLGALFILNHKSVFQQGMPPVAEIAEQAHREGALLDLDKHNWPWSMMLVPVAKVDLYELANNSIWRTEFGFRSSLVPPGKYMQVEQDAGGITERGWIRFGMENYYSLLNCGFTIRPTAGTASGVHPVPLGFGRVYVRLDGGFDLEKWIEGLRAGRSFVTTGPMLMATVEGRDPGARLEQPESSAKSYLVQGEALSEQPLEAIEVVVNGQVAKRVSAQNERLSSGAYRSTWSEPITITRSSWLAVRAWEPRPGGRVRFAHTGPVHMLVGEQPVRPRREEIEYLVQRMEQELERNRSVLPEKALAEFQQALKVYQQLMPGDTPPTE